MKIWDVLIDTPNFEQWIYGIKSDKEPTGMIDGCYIICAEESIDEGDVDDECGLSARIFAEIKGVDGE